MDKQTYSELLRHPLWQRKRLEVLEAHQFTCECCQSKDKTLHVHHGYYEKGCMPWEYPNESLHCLCEDCHQYVELSQGLLTRLIACLPVVELAALRGYVSTRLGKHAIPHPLCCTNYPLSFPKSISGATDDKEGVIMGWLVGCRLLGDSASEIKEYMEFCNLEDN